MPSPPRETLQAVFRTNKGDMWCPETEGAGNGWGVHVFLSWLEDPGHHGGGLGSCSRCTQGRALWVTKTDHTLRSLRIPFAPSSLLLFLCGKDGKWRTELPVVQRPCGEWAE